MGANWCPGWESNPHEEKSPEDFKSSASAIPPPGRWQYKVSESEELVQQKRLCRWLPMPAEAHLADAPSHSMTPYIFILSDADGREKRHFTTQVRRDHFRGAEGMSRLAERPRIDNVDGYDVRLAGCRDVVN